MRKFFAVLFLFVLLSFNSFAQSSGGGVRQLGDLLSNDTVTLTASGNGSSSGFAVMGFLKNNTQGEIRINVTIDGGLYFINSGKGQNMLAVQIFLSDGGYASDGTKNFLILPSRSNIPVVLDAYCADFDLDNPSSKESFKIASMPSAIKTIASKMSKYTADNFDSDSDYTTATQLALWRSQGKTRTEISKKFDFDDDDWKLSGAIINY